MRHVPVQIVGIICLFPVKNNKNNVRTIFVIIFEREITVFINYISLNGCLINKEEPAKDRQAGLIIPYV